MKVLYLDLDTLRADHLGCYGYPRRTSPNIDRFAREGTLFESFFGPTTPTIPAHTTIFSGQLGATHGVVSHGSDLSHLPLDAPWLPAILKRAGVLTAAIDNLIDFKPWFGRGWTEIYNPTHKKPSGQLVTADEINAYLLPWIRQHTEGDWFMFAHYWDPHTPYKPPDEYKETHYQGNSNDPSNTSLEPWRNEILWPVQEKWLVPMYGSVTDRDYIRSLYDGEITYLDDRLGQVFDLLEDLGIAEETVVIVAADHGEIMYEHRGWFAHVGLYDEIMRVPLIVRGPGTVRGQKIPQTFQHIDLAPTILSLFGVTVPEAMDGVSLAPALRGEPVEGYDAIYLTEATVQIKWGIRTPDWKLIKVIDPGVTQIDEDELYNLVDDPGEQRNLATEHPDVKDRLELQLRRWWDAKLGNRTDMLRAQATAGIPAREWLSLALRSRDLSYEEWMQKQRYI